ncbi:DUF1552 domain-containing protein [Verrucomicrobiales bacterium BCK34]|nr:DUF1552 domain-containing protein [Verrucomicrobiales bacterium BCK34]
MKTNRRRFIKGLGGALGLPFLESTSFAAEGPTTRFLVVGNPFGMHPDHFFPQDFGQDFTVSRTLKSMGWLKDRTTILSHTDHNMVSGHGREVAFLSGVLPTDAMAFPEKNMSVDQAVARHTGAQVRYPSLNIGLKSGVRMSWTANGVENALITDPRRLFDHLFLNLTEKEKKARRDVIARNGSILDTVGDQFSAILKSGSKADADRIDQYQTSVRELEATFANRESWIGKDKPSFDISEHYRGDVTIESEYNAIFDMVSYAFETDLTRVATIAFPTELGYTDVPGVTRSYHGCTHNGKMDDVTDELVAIESFQIAQLSRCLKRLDAIPEPNANGSMLDHTVVLFGSGMGYGGTHSNRNLPILVAGGGFKHLGHVDTRNDAGENMPLCNLYLTLLQRFGIERDEFNISTGAFDQLSV